MSTPAYYAEARTGKTHTTLCYDHKRHGKPTAATAAAMLAAYAPQFDDVGGIDVLAIYRNTGFHRGEVVATTEPA